ncbi:MAG: cysteine-rich small domain-containing protein [Pyramidobacter sp.]|nr:cysteine-rich small domain-containing protein [Pyramidobacter sp.]
MENNTEKKMDKQQALNSVPEECAYSFFSHKECEFFPCHKGADPENFNCLFCYCPLYALGPDCGGNFKYTEGGIKDCSDCLIPHGRKSYSYIAAHFGKIVEAMRKRPQND